MAETEMRVLHLTKGLQRFCVHYEAGQESRVLDELTAMVQRPELGFDWFDAAVLSHQLGQHLAKVLKRYVP